MRKHACLSSVYQATIQYYTNHNINIITEYVQTASIWEHCGESWSNTSMVEWTHTIALRSRNTPILTMGLLRMYSLPRKIPRTGTTCDMTPGGNIQDMINGPRLLIFWYLAFFSEHFWIMRDVCVCVWRGREGEGGTIINRYIKEELLLWCAN